MKVFFKAVIFLLCFAAPLLAQNSSSNLKPSWWNKFLYLFSNAPDPAPGSTSSITAGANVALRGESCFG